MADRYPVIEVRPERVTEPEGMGSKSKFWCSLEDGGANWLFKHPHPNSGEHWSEKIAAEAAALMGVEHAKVELAAFGGSRGSISESFTRGGIELIHGNQLLVEAVSDYQGDLKFSQSRHTLLNIWQALSASLPSDRIEGAKRTFAAYLTLDALIGNTDRHHENWGVQRANVGGEEDIRLAPSFDHASSLGRELLDDRRDMLLDENRVGGYSERGRGGIYWDEGERRGPSPIELARRAGVHPDYRAYFRGAMSRLNDIDEGALASIVNGVPDDWMSGSARNFALALMRYNLTQLREIPL